MRRRIADLLNRGIRAFADCSLWSVALLTVVSGVAVVFTRIAFAQHDRFATFGFDTGIFAQGTWLLSRGVEPFVTIRGLNIFGEHASYVLALVAPLYRLIPDPKLLLCLQVLGAVLPAVVIYRIGMDKAGKPAAFVVACAYLVFPGMNSAALWQFHPEALAAGFLSVAALCAYLRRYWLMLPWLVLAMACKEDVGLVVAGFGLYLFFSGVRRVGAAIAVAGAAYLLLASFVLIRLIDGEESLFFQRNYGIDPQGLGGLLSAAPQLLWRAADNVASIDGLTYLLLVFGAFAFLPLLHPKWLLPVCGPLLLNLASTVPYQRTLDYQYLATSSPFIALAAVGGIAVLRRYRHLYPTVMAATVSVALVVAMLEGPIPGSWRTATDTPPAIDRDRQRALALVPPDAAISAQANTVSHLSERPLVYEFPNPFLPANWGRRNEPVAPPVIDAVRYVLISPDVLSAAEARLLAQLRADPQWRTLQAGRVILLQKVAPPGPSRPGPGRAT